MNSETATCLSDKNFDSEITQDLLDAATKSLLVDEGIKLYPYKDIYGMITIGIGRNLTSDGISEEEAYALLKNDEISVCRHLLNNYDFFINLDQARQVALINLCFCVGHSGYCNFVNMNKYLASASYPEAANELLNSNFARELPSRAERLANIIKTGEIS